jgi:hypothetical protein
MSHKKSGLSSLINQAVAKKITSVQGASQLLGAPAKTGTPSVGKLVGIGSNSGASQPKEQSIQFGHPSSTSTGTSTQNSGSAWKGLLTNALSGGASSALSSFGGVGSLISGLAGLFAGSSKPQLPPLTLFTLPSSQEQTSYVHTDAVKTSAASTGPAYTTASVNPSGAQSSATSVTDGAAIAAAVKNALLTSNTLRDVITEL